MTGRVLLIIGGGIAAYKTPELVRLLAKAGMETRAVLTPAAEAFVTPITLAALTGAKVHQALLSLTDEQEMGHIELSRWADLLVVAPATADLMAKMAAGLANDLASTVLLATDKPVLIAPAMNVRMWEHPATVRNLEQLQSDGVATIGPDEGEMACGEWGRGRMAEPEAIVEAILARLNAKARTLAGKRVLVTAGPTYEPIDPVRGLTNRSSGKQGYAIAAALLELGAEVTLVTGPTALKPPRGVHLQPVTTALEMEAACRAALPVDAAVCVAAVADWRPEAKADRKIKKTGGEGVLRLVENPDILAGLSKGPQRPTIVVGFAAETQDIETHARAKLKAKGCDLIVANTVAGPKDAGVFGAETNTVTLVARSGVEHWDSVSKVDVARRLAARIAEGLASS